MGWSYARQVKAEIARETQGLLPDCIWAELWGLGGFSQPGEWAGGLVVGSALVARRAYSLMKILDLSPQIVVHRARRRMHFAIVPGEVRQVGDSRDLILSCGAAYLRGVFLARGYLGDPEHGIHLELGVKDSAQQALLAQVLGPLRIHPKMTVRRGRTIVYWKGRAQVTRLLAHMGAHQAVLEWETSQVMKTVKNRVNRLVNSETANLRRTVESGMEQARALQETVMDPALPQPLRDLAALRIAHPDWSLKELGLALVPPISKSAVNHRMRRLLRGHDAKEHRQY